MPESCTPPVQTPLEELWFRVRGTARDGQLVVLRSAKCTIGSAPFCTLRLVAPTVSDMHCLLVRGQQGVFARSWARDTRLNGRAFVDAWLTPGDVLSIGPIDLELVVPSERRFSTALAGDEPFGSATARDPSPMPSKHTAPQATARGTAARQAPVTPSAASPPAARSTVSLEAAEALVADVCRLRLQQVAAAAAARRQAEQFEQQTTSLRRQLAAGQTETVSRQTAVEKERDDWKQRCEQMREQVAEHVQSQKDQTSVWRTRLDEAQQQIQQLQRQQHESQTEARHEAAERATRLQQLVDQLRGQLKGVRSELADREQHWDAERLDWQQKILQMVGESGPSTNQVAGGEPPRLEDSLHRLQDLWKQQRAQLEDELAAKDRELNQLRRQLAGATQVAAPLKPATHVAAQPSDAPAAEPNLTMPITEQQLAESRQWSADKPVPQPASDLPGPRPPAPGPNATMLVSDIRESLPAGCASGDDSAEADQGADGSEVASAVDSSTQDADSDVETAEVETAESLVVEGIISADEDVSIDQYMQRLLARVRGDAVVVNVASQNQPQGQVDAESPQPKAERTYVPGVRPPQAESSQIGAMRELANETARSAIDLSARRRQRRNLVSRMLAGCAAAIVSAFLLFHAASGLSLWAIAGAVGLVASASLIVHSGRRYRRVRRRDQ